MVTRFAIGLLLVTGLLSGQEKADGTAANIWKPVQFLIGSWEAKTEGVSGGATGSGTYTFQLELRGHILARHSTTTGCKGPADFDCEHGDLMYLYQDSPGGPLRAIYFDNEGHVIHYDVTTPSADTAVFLSPAAQPGPQFRLVYELKDRTMHGRFQMRMPGQDEFKSYLEWSGAKKQVIK
jgi:hypothetical protein